MDLSSYATKTDLKNITYIDTSNFALKTNLSSLKTKVNKLGIDKLKPIPTDLSKLSNVVKNDVIKKTEYNKLVTKVDNRDTSGFALKTKCDADELKLENKIPDTIGFIKKTNYNTKITKLENKIPDINNLPTKTALTTVENKITSISGLATKPELNKIENKIPDISNLTTKTALTTVEN